MTLRDVMMHPLRVTCMLSRFSHIQLFVTPWTIAHQASLSMGFSRQEYWSRLPFSPPGDLPNPGIELESLSSPALAGRFFTTSTTREAPFDPQKSTEIPFKCCFSVKNCGLSTIFNTVRPWWKYRSWVFTVLGFPSKTLERSEAHHRDPAPGFPWAVVWTWAVPHSHSIRNKMGGGRVLYTSQLFSFLCSSPPIEVGLCITTCWPMGGIQWHSWRFPVSLLSRGVNPPSLESGGKPEVLWWTGRCATQLTFRTKPAFPQLVGVPGAESSQLGALLGVTGTAISLELLSLAQGQPASNGLGPPDLSWDFSKGSPKF